MTADQKSRLVIRAKDGTEIDLDAVRVRFEEVVESYRGSVARIHATEKRRANENLAILDALVAALSDHPTGFPVDRHTVEFVAGWNARGKAARQAAGVVYRDGVKSAWEDIVDDEEVSDEPGR